MPRIALLNILIGFTLIFLASCYGAFLSGDASYAVLLQKDLLNSWGFILRKSAHAHTNFFGILHVLLGLTMPYVKISSKVKKLQTTGLALGAFAMSVLLFIRSYNPPDPLSYDYLGWLLGFFLSCALLSLASHLFGLFSKIVK